MSPEARGQPDPVEGANSEPLSRTLTGGLVGLVFLVNFAILGYAMHVARPIGGLPDPVGDERGGPPRVVTAPVIPGLHGDHPLSTHQVGEVLIAELSCTACHADQRTPRRAAAGPDLTDVGTRVDPAFMRRFIADPAAADPGTTMPDLLGGRPADERERIAADITAFLIELGGGALGPGPGASVLPARATDRSARAASFRRGDPGIDEIVAGRALFHHVGCVACHPPRDATGRETDGDGLVTLGHVPSKYALRPLAEFLFQPLEVRPSGRMPDMTLTREEADAIAAMLLGPAPRQPVAAATEAGDAARGRLLFGELGCVACHAVPGVPTPRRETPLDTLDPSRGCLAGRPVGAADYRLDETQVRAIRAALAASGDAAEDDARIAMTLTRFNCIGCHVRDDYGGVSAARSRYFTTAEPSLGDAARIPPPLTRVGAKLRDDWLRGALFDAAAARPYMRVRMPQFGESNLRDLPELLDRADRVDPVERPALDEDGERAARDAGRLLVGSAGLNCVSCHSFAGRDSGFNGMDLIVAADRLEADWFHHFVRSPSLHRPGITMPGFWPGGIASRTDILDGDATAQIDAIRRYLLLGQTARLPDGVLVVRTTLDVTDVPRTYRGRSRVAGYRGIAVGFPERISYAFNAKTGTLTGLWRGDYVSVNWSGQGAGGFEPAARPIQLAQDVSFLDAIEVGAPWPRRPVTTEENPVDPDPLYPRNHGYAFEGYFFDDAFVPTFMYRCGDVGIEDRVVPEAGDDATLVRTLELTARARGTIWFRALTGPIVATPPHYEIPGLRLRVPETRAVLRDLATDGERELLLEVPVRDGRTTVTIRYELLD